VNEHPFQIPEKSPRFERHDWRQAAENQVRQEIKGKRAQALRQSGEIICFPNRLVGESAALKPELLGGN
jgi:hypothetical protein